MTPLMTTGRPYGSVAERVNVSEPLHQPLWNGFEQLRAGVMLGGVGGGSSGWQSSTHSFLEQQPLPQSHFATHRSPGLAKSCPEALGVTSGIKVKDSQTLTASIKAMNTRAGLSAFDMIFVIRGLDMGFPPKIYLRRSCWHVSSQILCPIL